MKPAFKVVAEGNDITAQIADRLLQLRVTDNAGQQSDSLEIGLDDRGAMVPLPASGSWLRVWVGYSEGGTEPAYMGAFAVDECELSNGPRSMTIKATASNTAPGLVREQRTQSWHDTTLGKIVEEIAQRNNLQPVIKGPLASTPIKHEDQTNESDQSFLTRLAEKYKAVIKPADGTLTMVPRGAGTASPAPAAIGRVNAAQATSLARQAGFNANEAVIMGAIAMAESSGNVRALNSRPPDLSYGLWQINMIGDLGPERRRQLGLRSNEDLYNPAVNARAARAIFQRQGFKAWSVYRSGAYRQYLGAAGAAGGVADVPLSSFAIRQSEVTNWRATIKSRGAYGGVTARYLDRKANKEFTTTAGEKGGALPVFEEKQLFRNKDEAEAAAASRLQALRSGEVRISLSMPGRPDINAEGLVTLSGFRPEVDGTWIVVSVTHDLGPSGYVTSLECGTQGEESNEWSTGSGTSSGAAGPGATRGVIARTGSTGDSTGAHLDARWADKRRITAADADRYIRVNGRPPSSFGVTSGYGPRALFGRTFHAGIDFGTPIGGRITLVNGARYVRNLGYTGAGGYAVEIATPEGNMRLLHLQAGSAR